jgi:predicted flap endonuclease-1-like 5' DNA nuclease
MGERLSTQLEVLRRERERLEELLMLDANWRALRQLEARAAAGKPMQDADPADLRAHLLDALSGNRLFAARAKLIETIDLLSSVPSEGGTSRVETFGMLGGGEPVSSRIVLLNQPGSESFRARVRMKPAETGDADASPAALADPPDASPASTPPGATGAVVSPSAVPDALELIDGLGRHAVEMLLWHGVRSFAEIAAWTPADAAAWRARLDGLADGHSSAWIEQAAMLAAGRETHYAARVRRGEFACLVPMPEPEPPRRPVDRPTSVTAIRASSPAPQPNGETASDDTDRLPLLSRLSLRRRGFARPAEPSLPSGPSPADVEAEEVVVITHRLDAREQTTASDTASPRHPNRLVHRLKQLDTEERFSASGYAAYRGEVEEASVTIIDPHSYLASSSRSARRVPDDARGADRTVSRFFRALTGKVTGKD